MSALPNIETHKSQCVELFTRQEADEAVLSITSIVTRRALGLDPIAIENHLYRQIVVGLPQTVRIKTVWLKTLVWRSRAINIAAKRS